MRERFKEVNVHFDFFLISLLSKNYKEKAISDWSHQLINNIFNNQYNNNNNNNTRTTSMELVKGLGTVIEGAAALVSFEQLLIHKQYTTIHQEDNLSFLHYIINSYDNHASTQPDARTTHAYAGEHDPAQGNTGSRRTTQVHAGEHKVIPYTPEFKHNNHTTQTQTT